MSRVVAVSRSRGIFLRETSVRLPLRHMHAISSDTTLSFFFLFYETARASRTLARFRARLPLLTVECAKEVRLCATKEARPNVRTMLSWWLRARTRKKIPMTHCIPEGISPLALHAGDPSSPSCAVCVRDTFFHSFSAITARASRNLYSRMRESRGKSEIRRFS